VTYAGHKFRWDTQEVYWGQGVLEIPVPKFQWRASRALDIFDNIYVLLEIIFASKHNDTYYILGRYLRTCKQENYLLGVLSPNP
jgi:hypothetical protein